MTQDAHIPAPREEPQSRLRVPGTHHANGLLIGGGLAALLFLVFIVAGGITLGTVISPLWIGFIIGVLVALLGAFRMVRGPEAFGLGDTEHKHPAA
ncbi:MULTISPECIES: hypothetical protein [Paeniglutamicibacter]|uniref:Sugar phosphate permease n=1 Tax=Paeniglutamicibacter sulfureus TaxID=43666 RepID=A0ABU2BI78_9MICC|nr:MULTISPECIES: hypothetical protein [Paeniglutamicibacter]MCV9993061.1 hypothetical protein [Paeniglutamicibacter sp. ZC-3]MDO2933348.1 hypothetical protein [Paeniglutamicibacter sulfureus]MDR7357659.1 sugar phosphate permease [Paeniglutamicibacter sulfureus]